MSRRNSRPVRKPVSARTKLSAPKKEGFVRRFVNDDPGRLEMFLEGGWEFVLKRSESDSESDSVDSRTSVHVGVHPSGEGKRAYLMEIRLDWYEDDQRDKQAAVDQIDDSIRSGIQGVENAYTPGQASASVVESPVTMRRG